jgi:putative Se/S carrier protein
MENVVLVFSSNAGTMIATKTLRDSGVAARMVPRPASVQSASNLCLSIDQAVEERAIEALTAARVSISAVCR